MEQFPTYPTSITLETVAIPEFATAVSANISQKEGETDKDMNTLSCAPAEEFPVKSLTKNW